MIWRWVLRDDDNAIENDGNNDDPKVKLRAAANRTRHSTIESSVSTRWHQTSNQKLHIFYNYFLSDPGVPGVQSMGPDVRHTWCSDLTDVTLADEDSNSIPTDDVNMIRSQ